MHSTTQIAVALEEWAASVIPDATTYRASGADLDGDFPIVRCEVVSDQRNPSRTRFAHLAFEGVELRERDVRVRVYVDDTDPQAADDNAYVATDALSDALKSDSTLGGRVADALETDGADFEPDGGTHVQTDDGLSARWATYTFAIGETED